ncbi:hypothetical protein O988_00412 [Pseudogymnoascus sp. VKM F-3808]|nr:hypothetical protein O988_00412 [Pseudogymnoascus sp. VKM F-3808]
MLQPSFATPPPKVADAIISFPNSYILLVIINRPQVLNCIGTRGDRELTALFSWLDSEPSLRCAIITGAGRAFCAGGDLKEWNDLNAKGEIKKTRGILWAFTEKREEARDRGCEWPLLWGEKAVFGLPEVKRGVVATAGALPRLTRIVGRPRAMEMALTGRPVSAQEAVKWGLVNKVVGSGGEGASSEVVVEAIRFANMIADNSPDSIIVTREGIKMGWEGVSAEEGTRILEEEWFPRMDQGENMKEGVRAFVEKRNPKWVASKL